VVNLFVFLYPTQPLSHEERVKSNSKNAFHRDDRGEGILLSRGDVAPDFDLPALIAGVKKRFRLSDRHGKQNIVLAFYPSNWDTVSAEQLVAYQVEREKVRGRNTEVVAISVDSIMNTTVWEREIGPLDFPLASDFWPHGEVCRAYGVLSDEGSAERAVFIVDRSGIISFSRTYPLNEIPDVRDTLEILARMHDAA
jgi:alkyl hydroperoxide reductase subunit AhpC